MHIKQHYNMHLSRYKQAEKFMSRPDVSIQQKDKWVPELKEITNKLSTILQSIGDYKIDEALDGFGFEEESEV